MKAYKIDLSMYEGKVREIISEAVQRKAFELGYKWRSAGTSCVNTYRPWLAFEAGGDIVWNLTGGNSLEAYTLISPADFLALTTAKDEPTFKPFDKVLVRDRDADEWIPALYSKKNIGRHVIIGSSSWTQCIPYEGNEHLLGTTEESK